MTTGNILDQLRTAWRQFRQDGWQVARLLADANRRESYRAEGARSLSAWAESNLGLPRSTTSRFLGVADHVQALPAPDRERWENLGVWDAVDAHGAVKHGADAEVVIDIAGDTALTTSQRRQKLRELVADRQHYSTEGLCRITATVTESTRDVWQRALRVARYLADEDSPSDDVLVQAIASGLLGEPLECDDATRTLIETGELRCDRCGSWKASELRRVGAAIRCGRCVGKVEEAA